MHWLYENDINNVNIQGVLDYKKYAEQHNRHMVYCIELDKVFASISDAAKKLRFSATTLRKHLKNEIASAGKHPNTGLPLHWKIYTKNINYVEI